MLDNKVFMFSSQDSILARLFEKNGGITTMDPKSAFDVAVFPTGPDVSPYLYGETVMSKTLCNPIRDLRENRFYRKLPRLVPKIGIGRGAQFLNVMNGGSLWQIVTGHASNHELLDLTSGDKIIVTSLHHQEMIPSQGGDILAVANVAEVKRTPSVEAHVDLHLNDHKKIFNDNEVVYYRNSESLCFQPRPELQHEMTASYFFKLLEDWVLPLIGTKSHVLQDYRTVA